MDLNMLDTSKVLRADSAESVFFTRQLAGIQAKTYDVLYPEFTATKYIPVSTEINPGAAYVLFRSFDRVGQCKLIASYADDLPRADVKAKESTVNVMSWGVHYGYSVLDVLQAMYAGVPLEQRRANAARLAWEQTLNRIGWLADGTAAWGGLYGLLYQPNITHDSAPSGSAWSTATSPDDMINDVNFCINQIANLTYGVESANIIVFPVKQAALLKTRPRATFSDRTVWEFLVENHPGVKFEVAPELAGLTTSPMGATLGTGVTVDTMVAFNSNPDKLLLHVSKPFEQMAPEVENLEWRISCWARTAGVIAYYPLAIHTVEGI